MILYRHCNMDIIDDLKSKRCHRLQLLKKRKKKKKENKGVVIFKL